ncbi:MAG: radical SAM protein [Candidatus Ancillula sp.]|jgi:pyruvate formate lyase activating enzyme|nr:radical SAM protein [Candidatus Ancillula sp.]
MVLKYFGIAPLSKYDGPLNRLVVYFQGCDIKCSWCHSPHSIPESSPLLFFAERCISCRKCVKACPNDVHSFVSGKHILNRANCTKCGLCVDTCPKSSANISASALILPTKGLSAQELFTKIEPYLALCDGITLSGGEALIQLDEILEFLKILKQNGVNIAVETSGLLLTRTYELVLDYVDIWLFGVRMLTDVDGKSNKNILLRNLHLLNQVQENMIIPRVPMVPGVFDNEKILFEIVQLLRSVEINKVWLLPWNMNYMVYYIAAGIGTRFIEPTRSEVNLCESFILNFFVEKGFDIIGSGI